MMKPLPDLGRAKERRSDIKAVLQRGKVQRQRAEKVLDMSPAEQEHKYLEGTGAFVLDRVNGIAYLNVSERADVGLAQQWVQDLGYRVSIINSCSRQRQQAAGIYR